MSAKHVLSWSSAFLVGSFLFPWYGVAAVGAVCGWYSVGRRPASSAALGAMLAWAILLVGVSFLGPIGALAGVLKGVIGLPAVGIYAVTLAFPGLLAGAAAGLAAEARSLKNENSG